MHLHHMLHIRVDPGFFWPHMLYHLNHTFDVRIRSHPTLEWPNRDINSEIFTLLIVLQAEPVSQGNIDKTVGTLLYTIASKLKAQIVEHRSLLTQYVSQRKIVSDPQLTGTVIADAKIFFAVSLSADLMNKVL